MFPRLLAVCAASAVALYAADDPWTKVRELKSGTEIRIVKRGTVQPVLAQMGDLTDENLVIIVKNEQKAIARDQIDRIDARPKGSGVKRESRVTTEQSVGKPEGPNPAPGVRTTQSVSNALEFSKPDFETVYRRTAKPDHRRGPEDAEKTVEKK